MSAGWVNVQLFAETPMSTTSKCFHGCFDGPSMLLVRPTNFPISSYIFFLYLLLLKTHILNTSLNSVFCVLLLGCWQLPNTTTTSTTKRKVSYCSFMWHFNSIHIMWDCGWGASRCSGPHTTFLQWGLLQQHGLHSKEFIWWIVHHMYLWVWYQMPFPCFRL